MTMDVFALRDSVIGDYQAFIQGFLSIRDDRIQAAVDTALQDGVLWPEPWLSLNPKFTPGGTVDQLADGGVIDARCKAAFRLGKSKADPVGTGLSLFRHQVEAIEAARSGDDYVLTTGTGSGKSLAYIIPIVDAVLREPPSKRIKAIVVYPMNALANSQSEELRKFLCEGYPDGRGPVTFARYTGQEGSEERQRIIADPPDILLTNYVMLELILTRTDERQLVAQAQDLRFLVLDELHTYRGRQGADVALLCRRLREATRSERLQCVGTSATLVSEGTLDAQRAEIAEVASRLFGTHLRPERVIGETLEAATRPCGELNSFLPELKDRMQSAPGGEPSDYAGFQRDPLARWIESTIGLTQREGRLVRAQPRTLVGPEGLVDSLVMLTGSTPALSEEALRRTLLAGSRITDPVTGRPVFAFKLHQFVSRGSAVYASPESPDIRVVSLSEQQYVPGDRNRRLLPVAFCRDGGQEYYVVERQTTAEGDFLVPRDLGDTDDMDDRRRVGFVYISSDQPWPEDPEAALDRLPPDWLEDDPGGGQRVPRHLRPLVPRPLWVGPDARVSDQSFDGGTRAWWVPAPFRFCLFSGASYAPTVRSDIAKLSTLGFEGRSTATTMLTLGALRFLEIHGQGVPRKLLNFTDNRQDAALQAGHFNDFVQVSLIRSALYTAMIDAGPDGLDYTTVAAATQTALGLAPTAYAQNPEAKFGAREGIDWALRDVLAYRLYVDLQAGWRVTAPNLEQVDLLRVRYAHLDELVAAEEEWAGCHDVLRFSTPAERAQVCIALLDHLRRDLAVKVDQLETSHQEAMVSRSNQHLISPWALDETERNLLDQAKAAFPGRLGQHASPQWKALGVRSLIGQFLRRRAFGTTLDTPGVTQVLSDLFRVLTVGGQLQPVAETTGPDGEVTGYQIPAAALRWTPGEGTRPARDLVRVPRPGSVAREANPFFVAFYQGVAATLAEFRAREHTAQVSNEERAKRETDFRQDRLPVLFCSPTMELGIDIATLNVVGMRNVPPTPANYAQRSGRAGRSGQPALVITYCSAGSAHDQYFFRRPTLMVSGQVRPPRLDLANEDLVRAHVHAVWLAESGMSLGRSLADVLEVTGRPASLALLPDRADDLADGAARSRATGHARRVLERLADALAGADWYTPTWLDETMAGVPAAFDAACGRWRDLYRAAEGQQVTQNDIANDNGRSPDDRRRAQHLRLQAERQKELLLNEARTDYQSDFYSYRYFGSEGFLPGYNFPRLPLSAYIPARRSQDTDQYLNRPRFVAISEFGPQARIYHEGSVYMVNQVMIPVSADADVDDPVVTTAAVQCDHCGYLHPAGSSAPDLCERCGADLALSGRRFGSLFRMTSVSTRRTERISSNQEERQRRGYEIRTSYRFSEVEGRPAVRTAVVHGTGAGPAGQGPTGAGGPGPAGPGEGHDGGDVLARLAYGPTATLTLINLGWNRRRDKAETGFVLDLERGRWASRPGDPQPGGDPNPGRTKVVVPYVDDRRNALVFDPVGTPTTIEFMSSLQAALKVGIQTAFDLEDSELGVAGLPEPTRRNSILLYEASEGGAGVLRHLVEDNDAMARVARTALDLCHFDPATLTDLERAPHAREKCEAACYDCLLSYTNQPDHRLVDRFEVRDYLGALARGSLSASPVGTDRSSHLDGLKRQCASELERRWLEHLDGRGLRLPDRAQVAMDGTRPDFVYDHAHQAVYVDGPHHDYPHRAARDADADARLFARGWDSLRFADPTEWDGILEAHPATFGRAAR